MPDVAEKQQELELEEIEVVEAEAEPEVDEQKAEVESQEETEAEAPKNDNEDELAQYSESVQRRIRTLTGKYREEERQRQAAVEYAEAIKKQNEELKNKLDNLGKSYQGEFGSRVESQIESAKQAYQKAYDDGDAEAMFEAQKNLSRLALDQAKLEESKSRQETKEAAPAPAPQPQQAQPQTAPDPKAEAWATKNEWFGSDQPMTYAAFGLHRQLIEDEGFDPSSDEYYNELDRRIRAEFPHKFKEQVRDTGPRVASAESTASKSSSPKKRRTVKLTPSQIAIAKRLNVPLEEYAKYVKD